MFCPKCGKQINDMSKFCMSCGCSIEEYKIDDKNSRHISSIRNNSDNINNVNTSVSQHINTYDAHSKIEMEKRRREDAANDQLNDVKKESISKIIKKKQRKATRPIKFIAILIILVSITVYAINNGYIRSDSIDKFTKVAENNASINDVSTNETTGHDESQGVDATEEVAEISEMDQESHEEDINTDDSQEENIQTNGKESYTFTEVSETLYATQKANMRDLPDKSGNVIGSLSANQEVQATGICDQTKWYRVVKDGTVAYVSNSLLTTEKKVEDTQVQTAKAEVEPSTINETPSVNNTPANPGITYIGNVKKKKLHSSDCKGQLPQESNRAYFNTLDEAVAAGYYQSNQCKNCKPFG